MTTFDKAFERVIGHEGLFQNDTKDRGNWTTGVIGQGSTKVLNTELVPCPTQMKISKISL